MEHQILLLLTLAFACNAPDLDEDGFDDLVDCDDSDASINPDADELCDGIDNDCDDSVDEEASDALSFFADADADGFGDAADQVDACEAPSGYTADNTDCDDSSDQAFPGGSEICDGLDNDCEGTIDEGASDATAFYADVDADTFGDSAIEVMACALPAGHAPRPGDCDDTNALINPEMDEICNGLDDNCDSVTDTDAVDKANLFEDADADGFGNPDVPLLECIGTPNTSENDQDCDDNNAALTDNCWGDFDGTTATEWTTLASPTQNLYSLQSAHLANAEPMLYNFYDSVGEAYDIGTDTWTSLTAESPVDGSRVWFQMAPVDDLFYGYRNGTLWSYEPATDTWATVVSELPTDTYTMTAVDEDGVVYGLSDTGVLMAYDTVTGVAVQTTTGLGYLYETRLSYDKSSRTLLIGGYSEANLYAVNVDTFAETTLTSIPESSLNDIFCTDGSGHLYAAGGSSGTSMWQYTVGTDTWAEIPELPASHGNNGSCVVSATGKLYVGSGSYRGFYSLDLY